MQEMVPELDDLKRKRIFNEEEIRQVVKRRREFEYGLQRTPSKHQDFLNYIRYEVAVECLRSRRSKALHWRKKTISDFAGLRRMHIIFDRGVRKFKGDKRMWYQYVDFCLRSGSTKVLSRVLLRALKLHPREVHLWLLAADRELKCGHIKAARTLLVRGLRFAPKSAKLWGEFLRLEVRVACHLQAVRDSPEGLDKSAPSANAWAPGRLLFRRGLKQLSSSPVACVALLVQAVQCLKEAQSEPSSGEGLKEWAAEVRAALAQWRPGIAEGQEWFEASEETATNMWEVWWTHELKCGSTWGTVADATATSAPPVVIRHLASTIASEAVKGAAVGESTAVETAAAVLAKFSGASRVATDAETVVAILEALERCAEEASHALEADKRLAEKASHALLERAIARHPKSGRLALLAWSAAADKRKGRRLPVLMSKAQSMQCEEAAAMLLLASPCVTQAEECATQVSERQGSLETVLRNLAPTAAPGPLVAAHLAEALARGGGEALQEACSDARAVARKLWDLPERRAIVLAAVLDGELRCWGMSTLAKSAPKALRQAKVLTDHFEELLGQFSDDDPEKEDWWIRYVQFVQGASSLGDAICSGLPSVTDLNWRAMRSVADQARYIEKAQRLLQLQSGGGV